MSGRRTIAPCLGTSTCSPGFGMRLCGHLSRYSDEHRERTPPVLVAGQVADVIVASQRGLFDLDGCRFTGFQIDIDLEFLDRGVVRLTVPVDNRDRDIATDRRFEVRRSESGGC